MTTKAKTPAQASAGKYLRRLAGSWRLYLLILPAVAYLAVFNYAPMYGLQIVFKNFRPSRGFAGSEWVGLKHFSRFLSYPNFLKIIGNTLTLSLYSLATFPCSVIAALLINELDNARFKRTVQMVSYAPHFVSVVVICAMLKLFCDRETGIFNTIISALGGPVENWMTVPAAFPHLYVWSGVWQSLGWGTIVYLAALSGVSSELHEAAEIDGANRLQIVCHINLPSILPTVVIMLILSCGNILSVGFEKVFLMQNSLNLDVSQVISTYVYQVGIIDNQYSYSAAIGLFNTVVNVTMVLLVNFIAKRVSGMSIW